MKRYFLVAIVLILTTFPGFSQEVVKVQKSAVTELENGKRFYLHPVIKGQTLYSISKAYDLSYDEIFRYNPESKNGLKENEILKIPVHPETKSAGYNASTQDTLLKKVALSADEEKDFLLHIVQPGETFFSLGKKFHTNVDELKNVNPGLGDYPKAGQILKIRKPEADSAKAEIDVIIHQVKPKETLYGISKQYNITINDILQYNQWLSERGLQVNDFIKIPKKIIPPPEKTTTESGKKHKDYLIHKVKSGENLFRIAKKYGVSVDGLMLYDTSLTTNIHLGQEIRIPLIKPTTSFIIHKSIKPEKLRTIAKKYEVPLKELKKINPQLKRKTRANQLVRIPINKDDLINILQEEDKIDSVSYLPVKDTAHIKQCIEHLEGEHPKMKIALLLPLYLDKSTPPEELTKEDLKKLKKFKPFRFLPFYESFLLAVDSISRKGVQVELSIFDIDHSMGKTVKLLNNEDMLDMDLIVGPLFKDDFTQFSNFAKLHEINIVNPLSKRNSFVENNDRVFKLMPDYRERRYLLSSAIQEDFPGANIVILQSKKALFHQDIHYLKSYFYFQRNTENLNQSFSAVLHSNIADSTLKKWHIHDLVVEGSGFDKLKNTLSSTQDNVVILLSDQTSFLKETEGKLIKYLTENPESSIHLFTYVNPEKVNSISTQTFIDLDTHFICDNGIDYASPGVKDFVKKCRENFHFEPSPKNYAFRAYDLGLFFLNAIYLYGKDFQNCLHYVPQNNLYNEYHFEHSPRNGYNNVHWNLMHMTKDGILKEN